jgi:Flagellar hook-length control protein FliK
MAEAVEGLRDLVQLAHSRGVAQARLVLHPAEFGGVEVHLRQRADGLQATVRADHHDALAVLERGAGDLRRALEARGVTVASLDFGLAPQQDGPGTGARDNLDGGWRLADAARTGRPGDDDESPLHAVSLASNRNLSAPTAGSLLDVLA